MNADERRSKTAVLSALIGGYDSGLPVQLRRDLHAPRGIRLAAPVAEVGVLKGGAATQGAELSPVQDVERLPSEIDALRLREVDAPGKRDALVVAREVAQFRVVPRDGAERGGGLRAKPRGWLEEAVR